MRTTVYPRKQLGLTLIEILVGCAIGVVGVLVIFQTVTVWNRQSQSSIAGGGADVSGTLALFNIERDVRLGGLGFAAAPTAFMGCAIEVNDTGGGRAFTLPLAPVRINSAASGAPDSIDVLYGNSSFATLGQTVLSSTSTSSFLKRREGFKQGDLVVIAGRSASGVPACVMHEITDTSNPDGFTVDYRPSVGYTNYYSGQAASAVYNPTTAYGPLTGATMFNLGNAPTRNRWSIGAGDTLQRAEIVRGTPAFDVADGIVNLKAEYGVDANLNGMIEAGEWTFTPPADWNAMLAVRVAALVRSSAFERSADAGASGTTGAVTTAAPTWGNGDIAHTFLMNNVDGTPDTNPTTPATLSNNWRQYRYRVFEKVIPLRNMIWS